MISAPEVTLQKSAAYLNRLVIAGATITTAQRQAVTALAKAIDGIGVSKFTAFYPFLGGTAVCHSLDLLANYPITWNGTVTHDANGITGDGSTGYGTTTAPSNLFSYDNVHLGVYARTLATLAQQIGSSYVHPYLMLWAGSVSYEMDSGAVGSSISGAVGPTGSYVGVGSPTAISAYRNGALLNEDLTPVAAAFNASAIYLLRASAGANTYSSANLALAHFGPKLTLAEVSILNTAVQAYQTALGRNV